jgi:hypothetical protein
LLATWTKFASKLAPTRTDSMPDDDTPIRPRSRAGIGLRIQQVRKGEGERLRAMARARPNARPRMAGPEWHPLEMLRHGRQRVLDSRLSSS